VNVQDIPGFEPSSIALSITLGYYNSPLVYIAMYSVENKLGYNYSIQNTHFIFADAYSIPNSQMIHG